MQRVARIEQIYALRSVKVGETFEVDDQDIAILLRLGRIDPQDGEEGYVQSEIGPVPEHNSVPAESPQVKPKHSAKNTKQSGQRRAT